MRGLLGWIGIGIGLGIGIELEDRRIGEVLMGD